MKNKSILLIIALCLCVCASHAAQKVKVACVGNSVTYGYGLQDREHDSYPVRLQHIRDIGRTSVCRSSIRRSTSSPIGWSSILA